LAFQSGRLRRDKSSMRSLAAHRIMQKKDI